MTKYYFQAQYLLIKDKKFRKSRTMRNISENILTDFSKPSLINVIFILRKDV